MAKILVIDDEEIIRERIKKLLILDNYEAFVAGDGEKGLEVFEKEKPDVALVDIKMPGMGGVEVLKKIKESAEETEVIMITGHGGVETAVTAIRAGAFGYVQKPVEYDELVIEIKRALEKQEMQKSLNEHVHNLELAHAELESLYQQLQREHEMATHVFANVVRRNNIESKYVKYLYSPMDIVGGDLFLSAVGSSGSQYAFLGDFTGHGLSAAIGAIPVSDIFYAMISKGFSIIDIVTEINGKLKKMLPTGLFLCAFLIELDCSRDRIIMWNGGLPDALIVGEQGEIKRRLRSNHLPLGVVDNDRLDTSVEVEEVVHGDRLYVYTDGVVEASNKDGEMFGQQRLEECITHIREPERRFDEICSGLVAFRSGAKQRDDIAIAEICCDLRPVEGFDGKASGEPEEISTIWRLVLELGPDILRMGKSLSHLIDILIGSQKGLYDHRENINLILSELYANALDWGLLGLNSTMKKDAEGFEQYYAARQEALATLDDGWIKIDLELFRQNKWGKLVVRVEDSGPGFDYHKTMPELFDNPALGGRGIKLVRSFCKDVVYEGKGNKVKAVYVWE